MSPAPGGSVFSCTAGLAPSAGSGMIKRGAPDKDNKELS